MIVVPVPLDPARDVALPPIRRKDLMTTRVQRRGEIGPDTVGWVVSHITSWEIDEDSLTLTEGGSGKPYLTITWRGRTVAFAFADVPERDVPGLIEWVE